MKIIRNYQLQIDIQNFSTWKLSLPFGAEVVGFVQIGAFGHMLTLEDFSDGPPLPVEEREFLTVTVGRQFEAAPRLKFLGTLLLTDPTPRFVTTAVQTQMVLPLVIFEVILPAPDSAIIH